MTRQITGRQRDVLELAAGGLTDKEIAGALGIGYHAVKGHLGSAYDRLGVSDRLSAVVAAGILARTPGLRGNPGTAGPSAVSTPETGHRAARGGGPRTMAEAQALFDAVRAAIEDGSLAVPDLMRSSAARCPSCGADL